MKRSHRRWHGIAWMLLLPVLLGGIYLAQQHPMPVVPTETNPPHPSKAGPLP